MFLLACLIGITHGAVLYPTETNPSAKSYARANAVTTAPQAPATQPSLSYMSTHNNTIVITSGTNSSLLTMPSITPSSCNGTDTSEYDNSWPSNTPSTPAGWVLYPTSLAVPCYLSAPSLCDWDFAARERYPWEISEFKDPYFNVSYPLDLYADNLSCESIWSSSLVTWIKTAPTAYIPVAKTPEYKTILATTATVSSTIYWMTTSIQTVVTSGSNYLLIPGKTYRYTDESVFSASLANYITTIEETTVLVPTPIADTRAYLLSSFPFTAAPPCCSKCSLFGKNAQVFQWPTPAPSPLISTLIDPRSNFTFVSPQVYIAFESLFATDLCGTRGSVLYTTLGFSSEELSTRQVYTYDVSFPPYNNPIPPTEYTQGTWGQFPVCTLVTTTFWQGLGDKEILTDAAAISKFSQNRYPIYLDGCSIYTVGDYPGSCVKQYSVSYNPCSPVLSVPTKLFSLNPLWTSCVQGISVFSDPPYTLTPGGPMSLITSHSATHQPYQPTMTSNTAIAGPRLAPMTPARTSVSLPKATAYNEPDPVGATLDSSAPLASGYIIGSEHLGDPSAAVTISNTVFSVLADGLSIAIGGTTTMAIDNFLASQASNLRYLYGTQTLSAGGSVITVDGIKISLMVGGSSVVIGSRTEGASVLVGWSLSHRRGATSSRQGTGSGGVLEQKGTQTPASRSSTSTGATLRPREDCWIWISGMLVGVCIIGVGLL